MGLLFLLSSWLSVSEEVASSLSSLLEDSDSSESTPGLTHNHDYSDGTNQQQARTFGIAFQRDHQLAGLALMEPGGLG